MVTRIASNSTCSSVRAIELSELYPCSRLIGLFNLVLQGLNHQLQLMYNKPIYAIIRNINFINFGAANIEGCEELPSRIAIVPQSQ